MCAHVLCLASNETKAWIVMTRKADRFAVLLLLVVPRMAADTYLARQALGWRWWLLERYTQSRPRWGSFSKQQQQQQQQQQPRKDVRRLATLALENVHAIMERILFSFVAGRSLNLRLLFQKLSTCGQNAFRYLVIYNGYQVNLLDSAHTYTRQQPFMKIKAPGTWAIHVAFMHQNQINLPQELFSSEVDRLINLVYSGVDRGINPAQISENVWAGWRTRHHCCLNMHSNNNRSLHSFSFCQIEVTKKIYAVAHWQNGIFQSFIGVISSGMFSTRDYASTPVICDMLSWERRK